MNKNLSMQDFLAGNASNVMNFDKADFQNSIDADTVGMYYSDKSNRWYIVLSNSETEKSYKPIGLDDTLKPGKPVQDAVAAAITATEVLKLKPADTKAKAALDKAEALIVPFALGLLDAEENYIYAGETENGKWLRLSPNAPGQLNVPTFGIGKVAERIGG